MGVVKSKDFSRWGVKAKHPLPIHPGIMHGGYFGKVKLGKIDHKHKIITLSVIKFSSIHSLIYQIRLVKNTKFFILLNDLLTYWLVYLNTHYLLYLISEAFLV
jgi:hypothetical protein